MFDFWRLLVGIRALARHAWDARARLGKPRHRDCGAHSGHGDAHAVRVRVLVARRHDGAPARTHSPAAPRQPQASLLATIHNRNLTSTSKSPAHLGPPGRPNGFTLMPRFPCSCWILSDVRRCALRFSALETLPFESELPAGLGGVAAPWFSWIGTGAGAASPAAAAAAALCALSLAIRSAIELVGLASAPTAGAAEGAGGAEGAATAGAGASPASPAFARRRARIAASSLDAMASRLVVRSGRGSASPALAVVRRSVYSGAGRVSWSLLENPGPKGRTGEERVPFRSGYATIKTNVGLTHGKL